MEIIAAPLAVPHGTLMPASNSVTASSEIEDVYPPSIPGSYGTGFLPNDPHLERHEARWRCLQWKQICGYSLF
jgi:hypothetical protein